VEDDPYDADLTQRAIAKTAPDVQLESVTRLAAAIERLQDPARPTVDALLSDLRLPDGDGLTLVNYVRERGLPMAIVIVTGQGDEEKAIALLKAGADDYIIKTGGYRERLSFVLEAACQRSRLAARAPARRLRILYIEHSASDLDLTQRHLRRYAPHIQVDSVSTAQQALDLLNPSPPGSGQGERFSFDLLLTDYRLPDGDGLEIVRAIRQQRRLDLPIVLVTGHGGEDVAVQAFKLGVDEYLVKQPGYLFQLPSVLENAFHRAQLRREQAALRASEARFRRLADNAQDVIFRLRVQPETAFEYISPALENLTGYRPDELYADFTLLFRNVHPDDRPILNELIASTTRPGAFMPASMQMRWLHKDGRVIWTEHRVVPVYDSAGVLVAVEGIARDVTEGKRAEEHIHRQMERLTALRTVDNAISSTLDLRVIVNVLLEQAVIQLGVAAADLLLFSPYTQTFEYLGATGFTQPISPGRSLSVGRSLALHAVLERRTIHLPLPVSMDASLARLLEAENIQVYLCTPLLVKGKVNGVLEVYLRQPFDPDREWLDFFETLAGQAAIAIENSQLFDSLQRSNDSLMQAYDATLEGWVRALDLRDKETEGHTRRVADVTARLARRMGVDDEHIIHVRRGALLHDIGKMALPDSILHKPGPLTPEEQAIVRRHPNSAYELLSAIDYLRPAIDIPYSHHERWDGSGYPRGLVGADIPLHARIFAVVDVWDALLSDRPYRPGWQPDHAIAYLRDNAGLLFDPAVVAEFLQMLDEEEE